MSSRLEANPPWVLDRFTKLLLTIAWLPVCMIPSAVLLVLRIHLDGFSVEIGVLLWWMCVGMSSPIYARIIGRVDAVRPATPTFVHGLEHLPSSLAQTVQEVRSIRADIGSTKHALERAWLLMQELEGAAPSERELVEQCGASLEGVRGLLVAASRTDRRRPSKYELSERLDAELAAFERALTEPQISYRLIPVSARS
jgi:hypothetical protein